MCNLLLSYLGGRVDFWCFVCFRCTETPKAMSQLNLIQLYLDVHLFFFCVFPCIGCYSLFSRVPGPFSLSTGCMLVCMLSSQLLYLPSQLPFGRDLIFSACDSVCILCVSSSVWAHRFRRTWHLRVSVLSALSSICRVIISWCIQAAASVILSFCFVAEQHFSVEMYT